MIPTGACEHSASGRVSRNRRGSWIRSLRPRSLRNDVSRRHPVHRGARIGAVDRLHGALDRGPQARDLGGGRRVGVIFPRALAVFERERIDRAVGDLAGPHRHVQPGEHLAHLGDERRLGVVAPRRHRVDHERERLLRLAREIDRLLHGREIEHREPHRDHHQRRDADRVGHRAGHVRRRIDERPFDPVGLAPARRSPGCRRACRCAAAARRCRAACARARSILAGRQSISMQRREGRLA